MKTMTNVKLSYLTAIGLFGASELCSSPLQYCVIDLSEGAASSSYPVSYLSEPPEGGFNTDEYKTGKLVLRRIEPGTFLMGGECETSFAKPFYIGIFEVTQRQWELVMGDNPSQNTGDMRPVEKVSYNMIRGADQGSQWPVSSSVDPDSFAGRLRQRTGRRFDLPTESQWEYACRAGTTSTFNNGGDSEADLVQLGRYSENQSDGRGGFAVKHTTVGSYLPNAWGLYDMHGNVFEWCLDLWGPVTNSVPDPPGAVSGSRGRLLRGGSWDDSAGSCTSSKRMSTLPFSAQSNYGFRLARTLDVGAAATQTTPMPVPHYWLRDHYPLIADVKEAYEAAAWAMASNGLNAVWECYVAGIDPTDRTALFRALISLNGDKPVISWTPKLSAEEESERVYTVFGREALGSGVWITPTNAASRFFKIGVELR